MPIPLRTADVIRRQTARIEFLAPKWPHHKQLLALAVMLGYESWEQLVSQLDKRAEHFVFDQDLDQESREQRWREQASNLASRLGILLPYALDLASQAQVLRDINRPWAPVYFGFGDRLLAEMDDIWWICMSETGHPLSPAGFRMSEGVLLSAVARRRLTRSIEENDVPTKTFIVPTNWPNELAISHTYFRLGDLVEVEPVPDYWLFKSKARKQSDWNTFHRTHYPTLSEREFAAKKTSWANARDQLYRAAGLNKRVKDGEQVTTTVREKVLGESWFWPLVARCPQSTLDRSRDLNEEFLRSLSESDEALLSMHEVGHEGNYIVRHAPVHTLKPLQQLPAAEVPGNSSTSAPSSPSRPFGDILDPVIEYFSSLASEGLVPFQRHEPRGDAFLDLTIEGIRFTAIIAGGGEPYLSAKPLHSGVATGSGVALGVSSINYVENDLLWGRARAGWWVCKYDNETRININSLSPAGRRTLAVQFGLLLRDPNSYAIVPAAYAEKLAFYASPAFEALKEWAIAHPRKIKRYPSNAYLGNWAQMAQGRFE